MDWILMADSVEEYAQAVFSSISTFWAFAAFCPLVLYEILRYTMPVVLMPLLKFCGLMPDREAAEKLFMRRQPFVSIVIAGRNESAIIRSTLKSLFEVPYPNREIIVVDDHSDDGMYDICKEYADAGQIRLFRNSAQSGRAGRAIASNFGLRMATGEFIISLDADTSYDRDMIERMIGPFCDPKVGVVAGNLKVLNVHESLWTVCQAMEYGISIGLWKRWTSYLHVTLQASGAFGAFRREALETFFGWDPELAEDADLSLKMRKAGWDIAFAPYAIAMTDVPAHLKPLMKQRLRWDKGTVRTYFHKHKDLMLPHRGSWKLALELMQEYFMIYLLSLTYLVYTAVLLCVDWKIWVFAQVFCYFIYVGTTYLAMLGSLYYSERRESEWFFLYYVPFFPIYKEIFRWVRIYANICETFRWHYRENYLPPSGYVNPPW